jgi:hypothetical protein
MYWLVTAQNAPKYGSVKPPELHIKFQLLEPVPVVTELKLDGTELQMVAASFHALHARLSPWINGYTPPLTVDSVAV